MKQFSAILVFVLLTASGLDTPAQIRTESGSGRPDADPSQGKLICVGGSAEGGAVGVTFPGVPSLGTMLRRRARLSRI